MKIIALKSFFWYVLFINVIRCCNFKQKLGVDLSGDPTSKSFSEFKEILNEARQNKLKLALHCGEVDNQVEIADMLEFGMDRLGHGTFISGNTDFFTIFLFYLQMSACSTGQNEEILLANKDISLECCLTSNYLCGTVSSYADHHFWRFFKNDHPVVICVCIWIINEKSYYFKK